MSEVHTPGPWTADGGLVGVYIEGRRHWTLVASVEEDLHDSHLPGEAEANARLIAAAPELLAFAHSIADPYAHWADDRLQLLRQPVGFPAGIARTILRARAAIAKATAGK